MSIVNMSKISLIGLVSDKEQIIETLMKLGAVEMVSVEDALQEPELDSLVSRDGNDAEVSAVEADLSRVKASIDYLDRYDRRKKKLFEARREIEFAKFEEAVQQQDKAWDIVNRIGEYDASLSSLRSEESKLRNLIATLKPWQQLDIPMEITATKYTEVLMGTVPVVVDVQRLEKDTFEAADECYIKLISTDREQNYLLVVYHKSHEDTVMSVLKQNGFSRISFREMTGTAESNINEASRKLKEIEDRRAAVEAGIAAMAHEKDNLEVLYDYLQIKRDKKKILGKLVKTDKSFMMEGWIPEGVAAQVEALVSECFACIIDIRQPDKDEEYPVLLENKTIGKTVEGITEMYSVPNSGEIDPNSVMAPFFILFFGLMLGDGGYGITMAALAGLVLWKFKLEDSMKRFMKLMFFCGLSTLFWGAMFGGWFGIESLSEHAQWFNPVDDPEQLLLYSLLFGVIHIYVGIAMRGVNLLRQKKYVAIIFDVLAWYVFFTGFVLFVLPYLPKMDPEGVQDYVVLGQYMLVGGGLVLILTQGRDKKGIIGKLVGGLSSLYDLVGFMSDVLSYSRLLALGLATSVIASIINEMALMLGVGNILQIVIVTLVLLAGHTFNFAINALGAYVHSSRLQYIEFFGKFYKGGGKSFQPFRLNTKYINFKRS